MFGLKKTLPIFSIEKITLTYRLSNSLKSVFVNYKFEPNAGGFKANFKSFLEEECGLAYDKDEKEHFFKLTKDIGNQCAKIHQQSMAKYSCKIESVRVPDTIINDIIFKDATRLSIEQDNMRRFETEIKQYLPPKIMTKLYPYQREGIAFCVSKNFKCLIADGMGLGKTLQSISALKVCKEKNYSDKQMRVLIICPSSLRVQWSEELKTWLPSDFSDKSILCVFKNVDMQKFNEQDHNCLIMSYSLAAKNQQFFYTNKFDFAIVDESHMLKNAKSKRTEAIVPILKRITQKLLLSGTPAFAKPSELYTQISIINSTLFPSFHNYGVRYCDGKQLHISIKGKFGNRYKPWDYSGSTNIAELNLLLKEKVMIRRVKEDVLKQLPEKLRTKIYLNAAINKSLQKESEKIKNLLLSLGVQNNTGAKNKNITFKNADDVKTVVKDVGGGDNINDNNDKDDDNADDSENGDDADINLYPDDEESVLQTYSKIGKVKIGAVIEYFEEFFESDENRERKILVFCHHKEMMDALDEFFSKKVPLKKIRIDGQCSSERRGKLVQQFQQDNDTKIALLSITAAGVGLTLTSASLVFFTELHWTPAAILQAEDRSHRIGQKNTVNICYMVLKDSFEEIMWRMLDKKFRNVSKLIDNDHESKGIKLQKFHKPESKAYDIMNSGNEETLKRKHSEHGNSEEISEEKGVKKRKKIVLDKK